MIGTRETVGRQCCRLPCYGGCEVSTIKDLYASTESCAFQIVKQEEAWVVFIELEFNSDEITWIPMLMWFYIAQSNTSQTGQWISERIGYGSIELTELNQSKTRDFERGEISTQPQAAVQLVPCSFS
jgi:hypothetical protein